MEHRLDEIVVVPRNGYINRLQAWASSAILAAQLDVPVKVMWEAEDAAPASADQLFASDLIERTFCDRSRLDARVGMRHEDLPRYLTVNPERRLIVLAGHDRGEQALMTDLVDALRHPSEPTTLLIIAGGKFHLATAEDFDRRRRLFYEQIAWSYDIDRPFDDELSRHGSYVALHVRGTDRSREAPTRRTVRAGLEQLLAATPERALFVAADSPAGRDRWSAVAKSLGFDPWSARGIDHDRTRAGAGQGALLDWRLLGASKGLVYTRASSFGEEAAVTTGRPEACIALSATAGRQRARAAADVGRAAITYPHRHGWFGRVGGTLPAEES